MRSNVERFAARVKEVIDRERSELEDVHWAIESGYDQDIVPSSMTKSYFLGELHEIDGEVFDITVEHLFTPINWSKLKMTQMWAVKNTPTGLLLTLSHNKESDLFYLSEVGTRGMEDSDEGRKLILAAYQEAIRHRYRFFSYGDAMLIR